MTLTLTEREAASFGPRELKQPGTVLWAWQTLSALKREWELRELTVKRYDETLAELVEHKAWELVPPAKPYGSLDAMLRAEIGHDAEEGRRLLDHGGDRRSEGFQVADSHLKKANQQSSESVERIKSRLQRDHPKIFQAYQAGKYRSARAAAIAAGIVRVPTPLEAAQKAVSKLSAGDRRRLMQWLGALPGGHNL
jgi:hypothetical protein